MFAGDEKILIILQLCKECNKNLDATEFTPLVNILPEINIGVSNDCSCASCAC